MSAANLVLSAEQIDRKVRRMAFEIFEKNDGQASLILAGIAGGGYQLAQMLHAELSKISSTAAQLVKITVNKVQPLSEPVTFDVDAKVLNGQAIVLIDDVLNTGKTLIYSLKPLLDLDTTKIETAVLVNRSHRHFPIAVRYAGLELATTLEEHIEVVLEGDRKGVYLS